MLNFIGTGSAFNTEKGNTSAFIKQGNSLLLIDCGGTVFHRLQELKLMDGLQHLYIIITHTHPDHVGSLGEAIFYSYYILNQRPTIFFPNKELMKTFLSSIGVSTDMYNLSSMEKTEVTDKSLGTFSIQFMATSHVDTIPAYGFLMKRNGNSFYYSGDANTISDSVVERIMSGEIERAYQDTCGLDYQGNNHLSLKKLCQIMPPEFRKKIYCMHLDKHIINEEIIEKGFHVVEPYRM